jgi:hypothetical protein
VVRSNAVSAVVRIEKYEFKTRKATASSGREFVAASARA